MSITSPEELLGLRTAGAVVHRMLEAMEQEVCPGITTAELDEVGATVMRQHGSSFGAGAGVQISGSELH
jgi:methionyl aminopeptidase